MIIINIRMITPIKIVNVVDNEVFLMQAVHQESDVIPENIDCIRAMLQMEDDNFKSIEKTNKSLRIN
ncbi:hypothetical protein MetfoDRAFT_1525 [Methanotorris formicicus Mc-S-70]|uniref:Uncharacterized protein n=1 Tax=Methanotorris formicicus Mc-S-70 TaxID=647171 RepID=H1L0F1_9EURY|nr:hypothetical protein MetfoDRAFT_1525 [Methanotorris formicicus Mc-S-70]